VGTRGNEQDAPIPVVRVTTTDWLKSTRPGHKTSPLGTIYWLHERAFVIIATAPGADSIWKTRGAVLLTAVVPHTNGQKRALA
jgi:hypothetical protein